MFATQRRVFCDKNSRVPYSNLSHTNPPFDSPMQRWINNVLTRAIKSHLVEFAILLSVGLKVTTVSIGYRFPSNQRPKIHPLMILILGRGQQAARLKSTHRRRRSDGEKVALGRLDAVK